MFSKMNKKKMEFQSSDEDVQIVDETEYLKRTSKLRGGAGTHTVNLSSVDDSVKVVEEKRDLRFDDGEDEGDDADSGFQSLDVSFEDDVSSEDDDSRDEDFRVNENERCSDFNSGDSSFDGGRGADFKRKGKRMTCTTCHRKRNEACLNENNPIGRDKNRLRKGEKIGRDWPGKRRTVGFESKLKNVSNEAYVDEEYVQWVQHCERENGRDNPGNSRHRQRKVGVESEPRKGYTSERFVDEEYVQWLHSESGNGLDNPGSSRCTTQRKVGVESEPRKRYMPEELESRVSASVVRTSVPVNRGSKKKRYRKKPKTPMDWCYEDFVRNEAESEGSSGSRRTEGNKPMKKGKKVTIKSTIQWINKHWK